MTPGRPTEGPESADEYGSLIDGFVNRQEHPRKLFSARRAVQMRLKQGKNALPKTYPFKVSQSPVPEEVFNRTAERSILYFPSAGELTCVGRSTRPDMIIGVDEFEAEIAKESTV